jgi:hypothetical protein
MRLDVVRSASRIASEVQVSLEKSNAGEGSSPHAILRMGDKEM